MKSKLQFYGPFVIALLAIVGWTVFFTYVSPTQVVDKIGISNSYIVAFILSTICGFSSLTGTTFYVAIAALAHGGANFFILGLVGGLGLCISDFAFFYIINKGRHVIDKHWLGISNFIKRYADKVSDPAVGLFVFLYSAFFPVPNDVLLLTLVVAGKPFRKIAPYLFAGDMVSTLLITYIAR